MSKIKDLYAIEEGIEDLMPVNKPSIDVIVGAVVKHVTAKSQDVYNYLYENAELGHGYDDEGHPETYFENFTAICDDLADMAIEHIMEDWQLDLTHDEYRQVLRKASDILADTYADYESEVIKELVQATKDEQELRDDFYNDRNLGIKKGE